MKTIIQISIMIFICSTMFAQTDLNSNLTYEEINELTSKLAMKLLLNDSQKFAISGLLKTFTSELQNITAGSGEIRYKDKQDLIPSINSQVEAFWK